MGVLEDKNYDFDFNEIILSTEDHINDEIQKLNSYEEKLLNLTEYIEQNKFFTT